MKFWLTEIKKIVAEESKLLLEFWNKDLKKQFGHDFLAYAASQMKIMTPTKVSETGLQSNDMGRNKIGDFGRKTSQLERTKVAQQFYVGQLSAPLEKRNNTRRRDEKLEPGFYVLENTGLKTKYSEHLDSAPTENDMVAIFGPFGSLLEAEKHFEDYSEETMRQHPNKI